jgi:hypothetical protein
MVFKKPVVVAMQKDGGKLNMKYIKSVSQLVPCQQLWLGKF